MAMENSEKTRIILAAVHAAATKGFNFLEWYKKQLNLGSMANIPEKTRIKHMCHLGFEKVLLFDHEFVKSFSKNCWKGLLKSMALHKSPVFALYQHLLRMGILDE